MKWALAVAGGFFALFVCCVLLSCAGLDLPSMVLFFAAFGWLNLLAKVLPQTSIDGMGILTGLVTLVLFTIGLHQLCGWLWSDSGGKRHWRRKWTAGIVLLVVTAFVAGISMVGISHQAAWLISSRDPWVSSDGPGPRTQSLHNLKQIGLALYNYQDTYGSLPPNRFNETGRPMHSWIAASLPYLENAPLYQRIRFDVPWNHAENKAAFATVLFLTSPSKREKSINADGYALAAYAGNGWVLGGRPPLRTADFTDGTANTILAGEVNSELKPWGDPTNWRDLARGINRVPHGFGSPWKGGANFLFADGTVKFLSDSTDPDVLRALGTPDGGEAVNAD
jgi:prepilin-type processing-associated H-X9-DG protein